MPERRPGQDLSTAIDAILNRHPAVGFALGLVRHGRRPFLQGHGSADNTSRTPITEDTVFRIGSLTKVFTAIAVLQLHEQERPGTPGGHSALVRWLPAG